MGFKINFSNAESAINAVTMLNLRQNLLESVVSGNFRLARSQQKEFAKIAVEDFDTYIKLPKVVYDNIPLVPLMSMFLKTLKFRIFYAFSKKTPDEKELKRKAKEYIKTISSSEMKARTVRISDLMKEKGVVV